MATVPTERLMRKKRRATLPVTSRSMALFRLGEACNNRCPMCSNSGRPEAFFIQRAELLARVERLAAWGFRRVILTGGEPTIHPAFFDVAEALRDRDITFDLNTHGRSFAPTSSEPTPADGAGFAERCVALGLERAIVSLHSHVEATSRAMSGFSAQAHADTIAGIAALMDAGVAVTLNLVLSHLNLGELEGFVAYVAERFSTDVAVKLCFPFTGGKGGDWEAIQLRYDDARQPLRAALDRGHALGLRMLTESVPPCIHGDPSREDTSRSGFGETHYLDDITGDRVYPIRHIEAQLKVWPERCQGCAALPRCPGVQEAYVRRYGAEELLPFEP